MVTEDLENKFSAICEPIPTWALCEVTRELTEEVDIGEVGKMYHVKFADGYETDVFEDELFG